MVVRGPKPATYPDIHIYPGDVPFSWKTTIRSDGQPIDITNSDVSCRLYDDGRELGALPLEKVDPVNGKVRVTFTEPLYAGMGRYSTLRFREDTILNFLLYQARVVKEA